MQSCDLNQVNFHLLLLDIFEKRCHVTQVHLRSLCIAGAALELPRCLSESPKPWDYSCASACLAKLVSSWLLPLPFSSYFILSFSEQFYVHLFFQVIKFNRHSAFTSLPFWLVYIWKVILRHFIATLKEQIEICTYIQYAAFGWRFTQTLFIPWKIKAIRLLKCLHDPQWEYSQRKWPEHSS